MKKILYSLLMISIIFVLAACEDPAFQTQYEVTLIAIDKEENKIETAEIRVNGYEQVGTNGVLQLNLRAGIYEAELVDTAGNYINTRHTFSVNGNEIINLVMDKYSKTYYFKVVDENGTELGNNFDVKVEGIEEVKVKKYDKYFTATLEIDTEYTVEVRDPEEYYKAKHINFVTDKDKDVIEIKLESNTSPVEFKLYLKSNYFYDDIDRVPINYAYVEYKGKKWTLSNEEGYKIDLPVGEREVYLTTLFGSEYRKTIEVTEGEENIVDVEFELPAEEVLVDKWNRMLGTDREVINRWNKKEISYAIIENDLSTNEIKDKIREGIDVIDELLVDIINFYEINESQNPDIKIEMYFKDNDKLTYGYYDPEYQKIMINFATPTNEYLVVVVAHELVHCLGFDHTGKTRNEAEKDIYRKDLMNGVIENINNSRLYDWLYSNDPESDKNVITLLYSMPFGIKNPFINTLE